MNENEILKKLEQLKETLMMERIRTTNEIYLSWEKGYQLIKKMEDEISDRQNKMGEDLEKENGS